MVETSRVAVIGGGSWATAIAKMLMNNEDHINWYMRNPEYISLFKLYRHNPNYLTDTEFDVDKIDFYSDLDEIIENSDVLIFAIPSAFLKDALSNVSVS